MGLTKSGALREKTQLPSHPVRRDRDHADKISLKKPTNFPEMSFAKKV